MLAQGGLTDRSGTVHLAYPRRCSLAVETDRLRRWAAAFSDPTKITPPWRLRFDTANAWQEGASS